MPDLLTEITQAAKAYYSQTNSFQLTATDFYDWLTTLPAAHQADVMSQGFIASQAVPDFLRYCLEARGYDMLVLTQILPSGLNGVVPRLFQSWHHYFFGRNQAEMSNE